MRKITLILLLVCSFFVVGMFSPKSIDHVSAETWCNCTNWECRSFTDLNGNTSTDCNCTAGDSCAAGYYVCNTGNGCCPIGIGGGSGGWTCFTTRAKVSMNGGQSKNKEEGVIGDKYF